MSEPMIDGQGEYSLKQVREITDSWDVLSDPRPLVAARLWKEIEVLRAKLSEVEKIIDPCPSPGGDVAWLVRYAIDNLAEHARKLQTDLEYERLRLAACGTAAMSNTRESAAKQRIGKDHPYWSGSYESVCTAVDEEMSLREKFESADAKAVELGCDFRSLQAQLAAREKERNFWCAEAQVWQGKNGEKIVELEKAKSWNDECATKAEKALDMAEKWKMAAAMVAADGGGFFSQYHEDTGTWDKEDPVFCLNMNDVFAWATSDAEQVPWEDIPEVYELWKKQGKGDDHLLVWACRKRNAKPQKPFFDQMKPEFQEQVKDLPRFGDTEVPVGNGQVCVFDDGWDEPSTEEKLAVLEKSTPSLLRRIGNAIRNAVSLDLGKI